LVQQLEQVVRGELYLLVEPLSGPVAAGDERAPVRPPGVAEDEGIACLGPFICALRETKMPLAMLVPAVLLGRFQVADRMLREIAN
jgi:hypothetical protein